MTLVIAHRGYSGKYPENSIKAFEKALCAGADIVEFDVRVTRDRKLVVLHDSRVDRTTNGNGLVRNMTLRDVRSVLDRQGNPVPTVEEAVKKLRGKCVIKFDIKDSGSEQIVVRLIKKFGIEESVIITSEIDSVLLNVKRMCSRIKTEMGGIKNPVNIKKIIKKAKYLGVDIISPHYTAVTERLVKAAHAEHLEVHVWPPEKSSDIKRMKDLNVDAIATPFPERAL